MKKIRVFFICKFSVSEVNFSTYLNRGVFVMIRNRKCNSIYILGRKFSYYIMKMYVVCSRQNCFTEAIQMSTLNINYFKEDRKGIPK